MARLKSLRYFVEPVLFLSVMAMSMEVSMVQQLIRTKVCVIGKFPNCTGKASRELVNASAPWIGSYNIVLSSLLFVTGLWFGSWADRYGRRNLLLLPSIGSIVSTINFIVSSYLMETTPMSVMVSALFIGLSSGTLGVFASCFGLISEVTSLEQRSTRIAIMEAMVFIGGSLGFFIVGFFLKRTSFVAMFSFELLVHISILLYIVYVLEQPVRLTPTDPWSTSVISIEHIRSLWQTVSRPRGNNLRRTIVLLLIASFILSFGLAATSSLTFTLLTSPPISWSSDEYSSYHAFMEIAEGFPLVVGLPLCLKFCKMKDTTSGLLGVLSRMLGLAGLALSTRPLTLYITLGLFSLSEFAVPSIRSIMSKVVGPDEKSKIFAFMSAQQSLAFVIVSALHFFPGSIMRIFPGYGMAIASSLQIVPLAVFVYLAFNLDTSAYNDDDDDDDSNNNISIG